MGKTGGIVEKRNSRGGTRRNLCFHVENCQYAEKTSSRDDRPFDLDIESTHGQPALCRARPVNVDDELEEIRWIRGLRGERLPAASYALLPNLKKGLFFAIGEGFEISSRLVSTHPSTNIFRRLAGARHVSPAVL